MPYAELHCHSAFSFLDGASHPQELAGEAVAQGHTALALTDHEGLHGAMEMAQALKRTPVRHITGAEMSVEDGSHLTLLCETRQGYRNLCRLITAAPADTRSSADRRAVRADHVVRIAGAPCRRPGVSVGLCQPRRRGPPDRGGALRRWLPPQPGGCCASSSPTTCGSRSAPVRAPGQRRNRLRCQLAERLEVHAVATGNVHAHSRARTRLQDAGRHRRLGAPRAIAVCAGPDGIPIDVAGVPVEAVREDWVVEDRWWTGSPVRRRYLELVLGDGSDVTVFCVLGLGRWFSQRA